MNLDDLPEPAEPRGRFCPHCGTRVAQRASQCYACHAWLDDGPRPRRLVPWADIVLFVVVGALIAGWWLNPISSAARPAQAAKGTTAPGPLSVFQPAVRIVLTSTPTPVITATQTISGTPGTPAAPAATATPVYHTVGAGQTVGEIAEEYGVKTADIISANGLTSDGFIHQGDKLLIPGTSYVPQPTPTPTPTGGTLIYTVKESDTLSGIAKQFGTTTDLILRANNLKQGDYLGIGQHILVPLSEETPQPGATATPPPAAVTFTPAPRVRTPDLLGPGTSAVFAPTDDVLLSWTSVGVLAPEEWYVVVVQPAEGMAIGPFWTRTTSWRLTPADRSQARATVYTWQVQVRKGTPGQSSLLLDTPSDVRHFTW